MSKYKITVKDNNVLLSDEDFIYNVYYYFENIKEYNKKFVNKQQLLGCAINYLPQYIYNKLIKLGLKNLRKGSN